LFTFFCVHFFEGDVSSATTATACLPDARPTIVTGEGVKFECNHSPDSRDEGGASDASAAKGGLTSKRAGAARQMKESDDRFRGGDESSYGQTARVQELLWL
jgi:hypothetical protein